MNSRKDGKTTKQTLQTIYNEELAELKKSSNFFALAIFIVLISSPIFLSLFLGIRPEKIEQLVLSFTCCVVPLLLGAYVIVSEFVQAREGISQIEATYKKICSLSNYSDIKEELFDLRDRYVIEIWKSKNYYLFSKNSYFHLVPIDNVTYVVNLKDPEFTDIHFTTHDGRKVVYETLTEFIDDIKK